MRWPLTEPLFQATSFRLAAAQTALFTALLMAAGGTGLLALRHAHDSALDSAISAQLAHLREVEDRQGPAALARAIEVLQNDTGDWELRLSDPAGRRLAGDLPDAAWPEGLATRRLVEGDRAGEAPETIRAGTAALGDGLRMTVGRDLGPRRRSDAAETAALAGLCLFVLAAGLALGLVVSSRALRRIDEMRTAVLAYAAGDGAARAPVAPRGRSDLDGLARALNEMLDRETRLTQGLRRVSASVAHDLKRPLLRHNQEIARALEQARTPEALREALASAQLRAGEVLTIFQAMLHLAELEAGAPGLPREPVDLYAVARRVAEAYAPGAQDGGHTLVFDGVPGAWVAGEPRLLGRAIANLVENALTHTPPGSAVRLAVSPPARLEVSDDGPGVPPEELDAIFEPFHRLDAARGTPGTGLGLPLVRGVAQALGGEARAELRHPGLAVAVVFPPVAAPDPVR